MASLRLEILGHGLMYREGVAAINRVSRQMAGGLYPEGVRLMDLMKDRTPYETGELKKSGIVHRPRKEGNEVLVYLSFGNEDVDYAIKVHESLKHRHTVGRAKFMESVVQEEHENVGHNILARVK